MKIKNIYFAVVMLLGLTNCAAQSGGSRKQSARDFIRSREKTDPNMNGIQHSRIKKTNINTVSVAPDKKNKKQKDQSKSYYKK